MNQNIRNFLKSELNVAYSYLDRCFFVVSSNLSIKNNLNLKRKIELYYRELFNIISDIFELNAPKLKIEGDDYKLMLKTSFDICLNLLNLEINEEKYIGLYQKLFRYYYDKAYFFHVISLDQKNLDINPPRSHFITPISNDSQEVLKYKIDWDIVVNLKESSNLFMSSLQEKRDDCYAKAILEGHDYIYKKEYNQALTAFGKARNFKEDAEVLNLIGWTYSFLEKLDLAEKFALKSIRKDPDYGAAYNDLGSYLLSRNKVKEALEWFKMAKNSANYQNREYPYINSGRAYLMLKDYPNALEEFSYALTLAPYHDELHETVSNLQKTMDRSKNKLNPLQETETHPPIF